MNEKYYWKRVEQLETELATIELEEGLVLSLLTIILFVTWHLIKHSLTQTQGRWGGEPLLQEIFAGGVCNQDLWTSNEKNSRRGKCFFLFQQQAKNTEDHKILRLFKASQSFMGSYIIMMSFYHHENILFSCWLSTFFSILSLSKRQKCVLTFYEMDISFLCVTYNSV